MNKGLKTQGFTQGIFQQSQFQTEYLDTVRVTEGGRVFAYSQAGATALGVGKVTTSPIPVSGQNHQNRTIGAVAAVGATSVVCTLGAAVTDNYYKNGWMHVNDCGAGTGEAYVYRIKSHPSGTTLVLFDLIDPIRLACTIAAQLSFTQNRQSLVIVLPAAAAVMSSCVAGVPPIPVTAGYYFWNQVKGPAAVLAGGTLAIGEECGPDITVPGAVIALVHATGTDVTLGTVMDIAANTEYALINLSVPGY
jgi:hypothetical protein